jgi:hypothetical protein
VDGEGVRGALGDEIGCDSFPCGFLATSKEAGDGSVAQGDDKGEQ